MLARVRSLSVLGVDAFEVQVEVDLAPGLPMFNTVGLPNGAVRESKERVRAALANSGFDLPLGRITVNLAPADIRKEGAGFDLPIAIGILAASGAFPSQSLMPLAVVGELALDGTIRPVKGVLPMTVAAARLPGVTGVVAPADNANEAAVVAGPKVLAARRLEQVVEHLRGAQPLPTVNLDPRVLLGSNGAGQADMNEVRGQEHVKRALTIAAAGGHNVLMV